MIENQLEKTRTEYIKIGVSNTIQNEWNDLSSKLSNQTQTHKYGSRPVLGAIIIVAIIITGIFSVAQAAKPGQVLYPVKLLSDEIVATVSKNPTYKLERRGQEIIDLSSSSSEDLDEAVQKYQETLVDDKEKAQSYGKTEEFKNIIEKQENDFKEAASKNPTSQEKLQEVINSAGKAKGEVKDQSNNNEPQNENKPQPTQKPQNQSENPQNQHPDYIPGKSGK